MCWNQEISLNTFVFGVMALLFLFFTNTFSKYKIKLFSNPFMYVFFLEVILVQLMEFFLWRNLDNKIINRNLTIMVSLLVFVQPPTLAMIIKNTTVRYKIITSYFVFLLFCFFYLLFREKNSSFSFYTNVAKNGHLDWKWIKMRKYDEIMVLVYLAFFLISAYFIGNTILLSLIFFSIAISMYFYKTDETFSTMWCWLANIGFLLMLFNVLIVMPFYEYE